jgi:hypothetical protein
MVTKKRITYGEISEVYARHPNLLHRTLSFYNKILFLVNVGFHESLPWHHIPEVSNHQCNCRDNLCVYCPLKAAICEVTPQAIWPIAKFLTKRGGPKAPLAIHGHLGPYFIQLIKPT